MSTSGPASAKDTLANLEKDHAATVRILRELALFENSAQKAYATALAQNLVYALRPENDAITPSEVEALAGFLLQLRFELVSNATLSVRNPQYFTRILMQAIFDDANFIIDTADQKQKESLRQLILDIDDDSKEEAPLIAKLKALFDETFSKPRVIATLLPFYHDFLNQPGKSGEVVDKDARKKVFLGQIAFPFVESALVRQIKQSDAELITLGNTLRSLRKETDLYSSLIANLDKALPGYKPAELSKKTLLSMVTHYNACQAYLKFDEEIKAHISDWEAYAKIFEMHSPCRTLFSELAADIADVLTDRTKKLKAEYRTAEEVSALIADARIVVDGVLKPYQELRESFEPFRERAQQLSKIFKQLAEDFPKKSDRARRYHDLSLATLEILADLENEISKSYTDVDDNQLIDKANEKLTTLIKNEINVVVAGQTPLQRIANQLGKVKGSEQKQKLERSLERLATEGADLSATTHQYRPRAATTVLSDLASNLASFRNPILPRSRSATEIAVMNGASAATVEKLSPRAKPTSSWSWLRGAPKKMMATVQSYAGFHRLTELMNGLSGYLSKQQSIKPKPAPAEADRSENARTLQILVDSGYSSLTHRFDAERATASPSASAAAPAVLRSGVGVEEEVDLQNGNRRAVTVS